MTPARTDQAMLCTGIFDIKGIFIGDRTVQEGK